MSLIGYKTSKKRERMLGMQKQVREKSEGVRFLEWIAENPVGWEKLYHGSTGNVTEPIKTIEDFEMLTNSGLYSSMFTVMFGDVGIIIGRVFRKMVAQYLLDRIEAVGELEASKEILNSLRQEWERIRNETERQEN